jgi:hypothetical protein
MALNHVCKWTEHGWVRTDAMGFAEEAKGPVPASSHMLMCEICGQYVTLAYGSKREPYFKHTKNENKDCPDRTQYLTLDALEAMKRKFFLPLKIEIQSNTYANFYLGIPSGCLNQDCEDGEIVIKHDGKVLHRSIERLDFGKMSYLSLGGFPSKIYELSDVGSILKENCPRQVEGISEEGALFEKLDEKTGKKLPPDADVVINQPYLLVCKKGKSFFYKFHYLDVHQICEIKDGWQRRFVYEIKATLFSKENAEFFQDLHTRLTDVPVQLYPVWPVYVERPYQILSREPTIFFYLTGRFVEFRIYPPSILQKISSSESGASCYKIRYQDRQYMAFASRTNALQFTFFNTTDVEFANHAKTKVTVLDDNGQKIEQGEQTELPIHNQINVLMAFNGYAELSGSDGVLKEKISIKADEKLQIKDLHSGCRLKIYCGQDCVWQIFYKKKNQETNRSSLDSEILHQIMSYNDDLIPVPRALGAMILKFKDNKKLTRWFARQIHKGKISRRALKLLIMKVSEDKKNE